MKDTFNPAHPTCLIIYLYEVQKVPTNISQLRILGSLLLTIHNRITNNLVSWGSCLFISVNLEGMVVE